MTAKTLTLRLLGALGLSAAFAVAAGSALVLHAELPAGRRVLGNVLKRALDATFQGSFSIGKITRVGASGLTAEDVIVRDPNGRTVLSVSQIRAQADLAGIFHELVFGGDKITLVVDHAHVARAEATVLDDPRTGLPTLASAFTLRPSAPSSDSKGPGRHVRVAVRSVELTRGFARGRFRDLPVLEVDVRSVRGWVLATPLGAEIALSRFGTVVRGLGGADARGVTSFRLRAPGWLYSTFDGYFGEIQVGSVVRIEGSRMSATLDVPRARPQDVRAVLPGYPLRNDTSLRAEGTGTLPRLSLSGRAESGDSRLAFSGPVRLWGGAGADLEVAGRRVDLRHIVEGSPRTELDLRARVEIAREPNGTLGLRVDANTRPTTIEGVELPAAEISGAWRSGRFDGRALLHEPGLPLELEFAFLPNGAVDLKGQTQRIRIESVPRIAALTRARGAAKLSGQAHIEGGRFNADLGGDVEGLSYGLVTLGHGKLHANARGKLEAPSDLRLDATLSGARFSAGQLEFDRVEAHATGPMKQPKIQASLSNAAGPAIEADATLSPREGGARLDHLTLEVKRDKAELRGKVSRLDIERGRVEVQDLELHGVGGSLTGSARIEPDLVTVAADAKDLDLGALGSLLGMPGHFMRGRLKLSADVAIASDVERGEASFELADATLGPVDGVSINGRARLADHRLEGSADASVKGIGNAHAEIDAVLAGRALSAAAFRDMVGEAKIAVHDVDLTLFGHALAPGTEIEALRGKVSAEARFARQVPYALPSVSLIGFTEGFALAADSGKSESFVVSGVDARFGANVSGDSGEMDSNLQLVDREGVLASASASARIDLVEALRAPENLKEQLMATPLVAKLLVPERSLDHLPAFLQPPAVNAELRADASLTGNLKDPRIAAKIELGKLGVSAVRSERPVDVCANVAWEVTTGRLVSGGEAFLSNPEKARCEGRRVARYSLTGNLARKGPGAPLRLEGSAVATLEDLPLDAVPGLGDAGISGRASGSLSLADEGAIPRVVAGLELEDIRIHDAAIGDGKLEARSDDRAFGATLELREGEGRIAGTLLAGLEAGSPLPKLDRKRAVGFRIEAHKVDAAVLSPLTRDVLHDIGGRVDADLTASLEPDASGKQSGTLRGRFALSEGNLEVKGLGLRLEDVTLVARAETRGRETEVTIERLTGRAGKNDERMNIEHGRIWLEGLELSRAEGSLNATELPIALEGLSQATATTRQSIGFNLNRTPERMEVSFVVPYLVVALPQSGARRLVSLDENQSIEIVQPLAEQRSHSEGQPWFLSFELGENVKLTRSDMDLPLTGTAAVLLASDTKVTGDLELIPGGRVDVSGKTFVIESGEVHFDTGQANNPRIRIVASWRAPDGTVVFVNLAGALQDPVPSFTSEPGRPQQEIYALLLGGGAGEGGDAGATASGVGADKLLQPLLANTPLRTVEFRAGNEQISEERSYATYTAAVPIGEDVWFEGSYKSLNVQEDGMGRDAVSGTVDWRFRKNWSLRTEVGTIGTGVNLVWQYHY